MVKVLAMYLPQFHEIPENNEWWGKGFTEWVNTKKSKPLFWGHYQPREPLNDNYYSLLDVDTLKWQAELASQYGIYGFCIYHYWFGGKKLLEKPAEILLNSPEVKINYCFSWANESWVRTWDGRGKDVLMQQNYGEKSEWREHFEYLLGFFKDDRYIKKENRPVFLIYRSTEFDRFDEMFTYWDHLCLENGFDGLYLVETLNAFVGKKSLQTSKEVMEFEPSFTRANRVPLGYSVAKKIISKVYKNLKIDYYGLIWRYILNGKPAIPGKTIPGAFVGWDNSARRKNGASLFIDGDPAKFERYVTRQIGYAKTKYKSEFLFINAWNEWAEGAYLEPDKKHRYKYLEALSRAIKKNSGT